MVLRGRCLPYGEGITYYPVVEAVKQAAGLADFDLPEVVEAKVCAVLEGDEHQELVCRRVAQLLGVAETAAPEETFWAIRHFLEARARSAARGRLRRLHWGEPTFSIWSSTSLTGPAAPRSCCCAWLARAARRRPGLGRREAQRGDHVPRATHASTGRDTDRNLLGSADLPTDSRRRIRAGRGQSAVRRGDVRDADRRRPPHPREDGWQVTGDSPRSPFHPRSRRCSPLA